MNPRMQDRTVEKEGIAQSLEDGLPDRRYVDATFCPDFPLSINAKIPNDVELAVACISYNSFESLRQFWG